MTRLSLHFNNIPPERLTDKEISEDIKALEGMIIDLKDLQRARQSKPLNVDEVKIDYVKRMIKDWLSSNWSCYSCKYSMNETLMSILELLEG